MSNAQNEYLSIVFLSNKLPISMCRYVSVFVSRGVAKRIKNLVYILALYLEWIYVELQFVSMWNLINLSLNKISFIKLLGLGK